MFRLLRDILLFIVAVAEIVLTLRFVLRLLGANPSADIVSWVFDLSQPFLAPFALVFPTASVRGGFALEFSTLFAIFAYAVIAYVIQEVFTYFVRRT